jgi:hypothetical protein
MGPSKLGALQVRLFAVGLALGVHGMLQTMLKRLQGDVSHTVLTRVTACSMYLLHVNVRLVAARQTAWQSTHHHELTTKG